MPVIPGMAHLPGGKPGYQCRDCKHYGGKGRLHFQKPGPCTLYQATAPKQGRFTGAVPMETPACKKFELRG